MVFELLGSDPAYAEALVDADSPGFELDNETLKAGLGLGRARDGTP